MMFGAQHQKKADHNGAEVPQFRKFQRVAANLSPMLQPNLFRSLGGTRRLKMRHRAKSPSVSELIWIAWFK